MKTIIKSNTRTFLIIFISLILSLHSSIYGQENNPLAKETDRPSRDYKVLFERLFELGLPDVTKAQYVRFDGVGVKFISRTENFNANGWLQNENKEGENTFIVNGCRQCKAYSWNVLKDIRKKEITQKEEKEPDIYKKKLIKIYYSHNYDGRCEASWENASFKKELEEILSDKRIFNSKIDDGISYLLFTAAHAYRLGYAEKANILADRLHENAGSDQKLMDAGIDAIANAKYNEALDKFFDCGDWKELSKYLDILIGKYTTGWLNAPAVKRVANDVRKRASSTTVPEIAGEGLDEEDRELGKELADTDNNKLGYFAYGDGYNQEYCFYDDLWILQDVSRQRKHANEVAIDKIKKRGIKSFPLLLALLKDEYPVNVDILRIRFDGSFYARNRDLVDDPSEKLYESLRRPATRQDLAAFLLDPLWDYDDNIRKLGKEAFFKRYQDWYDKNKNKNVNELAKLYLTGPRRGASKDIEALHFLIETAYDMESDEIERYFLESNYGIGEICVDWAKLYLEKRGNKAKEFAGKMLLKLDEQLAKKKESEGHLESWDTDRIKYVFPVFKDAINPRSDQEILDEILTDRSKFEENWPILQNRSGNDHSRERIKLILKAAANAKDPEISLDLVNSVCWLYGTNIEPKRGMISGWEPLNEKTYFAEGPPPIGGTADLWRKLLNDNRELAASSQMKDSSGKSRQAVGEKIPFYIDYLYGDVELVKRESAAKALFGDERIASIKKERAIKILEGVKDPELPQYPSSENVKPERKKERFNELMNVRGDEARRIITTFTEDEKMAIQEDAGFNHESLGDLWKTANTVMKIDSEVPEWESLSEIAGVRGRPFDKDTCLRILNICIRLASEEKPVKCEIRRENLLAGVAIRLMKNTDFKIDRNWGITEGMKNNGCVEGQLEFAATWPVKSEKDEAVNDKLRQEIDDYRKLFWEGVEDFCNGNDNFLVHKKILFTGFLGKNSNIVSGEKKKN
ncbi:MAG: hypothetical protein WAX69_13535 [Victivallales bacterium]